VVIDAMSRQTLWEADSGRAAVPASTTKVVTSTAALAALGPSARLTTKVVRKGNRIILVGGGDPTLSSQAATGYPKFASLSDLAKRTATALKAARVTRVTVDYDASLYQGPVLGPGWKPTYVTEGSVAPVSALMVDNGRVAPNPCEGVETPVEDGPGTATQKFAQQLKRFGIKAAVGQSTKAAGAPEIAEVQSPPMSALVEHLLECSDNDVAEAMTRHIALKRGLPASFDGGAEAVHDVLQDLGVAQGIATVDGSGLSPLDKITPIGLARLVATAAAGKRPELRTVIIGMPVAGFSGTLTDRYLGATTKVGAGAVRAKTGTLNHVATLAGVTTDKDGRLLAFAFMANDVTDIVMARAALDQLASTLTSCGC
jgi:D-alanyl-D-alanine carboxypeptidase/D-alanyl-D-alanine-endopeptidase (penicillin-binding protein 4)